MTGEYYILTGDQKEGPFDLLGIMRRVRAGKIKSDTEIFIGDSEFSKRADVIDEIAPFFNRLIEGPATARATPAASSLDALIKAGWHFTLEHNIMTVYAGGMLILVLMLTLVLISHLGLYPGVFISWCFFMILHSMYFIFSLRLFRGQTFGEDFINNQLAPVLVAVLVSSLAYATLIAIGTTLLILPGILVAAFFIFVPIILIDKQCSLGDAFKRSFAMVRKSGSKQIVTLSILLALHLLGFALIMVVPLTLPIFIAALCEMYEKLST